MDKTPDLLRQRYLLVWYTYEIEPQGVFVRERGLLGFRKYRVPFEQMLAEPVEVSLYSRMWLLISLFLWTLAVVTGVGWWMGREVAGSAYILWGCLALVTTAAFLLSRQSLVVLSGQGPDLVLQRDKPGKPAFEAFLAEVRDRKRAYLIEHHLLRETASNADAIHKLAWLMEQGAISPEEFEVLKNDVVREAQRRTLPPTWLN